MTDRDYVFCGLCSNKCEIGLYDEHYIMDLCGKCYLSTKQKENKMTENTGMSVTPICQNCTNGMDMCTCKRPKAKVTFEWKRVKNTTHTYRAKVIGGWIITVEGELSDSACFIPDPYHEWEIE